jgi:hypothetical protein
MNIGNITNIVATYLDVSIHNGLSFFPFDLQSGFLVISFSPSEMSVAMAVSASMVFRRSEDDRSMSSYTGIVARRYSICT